MKKNEGQVYYTVTRMDGTQERTVASIKDVYILLSDRMQLLELEIQYFKIEVQSLKSIQKIMHGAIIVLFLTCIAMFCGLGVNAYKLMGG